MPYRNTRIYSIDEMPNLRDHLGKARTDRIRYTSGHSAHRSLATRNTPNPHLDYMQRFTPHDGSPVDDIVVGISRLDHHSTRTGRSIPLSVSRMYNILQCMETINTPELERMLGVETRQAQKYLKAIKLVIYHISRFKSTQEELDRIQPITSQ